MKNQTPPSTMSMLETLEYYGPAKVDPNELYAALAEAEDVRDVLEDYDLDPKDLKDELERLYEIEAKQQKDYEDYKSFFEGVINSWQDTLANGHWPCAEPWDQNLINAIHEDMAAGADAIQTLIEIRDYDESNPSDGDETRKQMAAGWLEENDK